MKGKGSMSIPGKISYTRQSFITLGFMLRMLDVIYRAIGWVFVDDVWILYEVSIRHTSKRRVR
jgi:hypothetical protein